MIKNSSKQNTFSLPKGKWLKDFRQKLLAWYAEHARILPWRGTTDPYKVWVSEIMLQQTTTAAVEGYYYRFLERFPNPQTLAEAEDSEVLRYWEGLGYYRRAVQLHRAAKVIVSEHNGQFPDACDKILALPGVGRYTAGAISSIAYHQRTPILEANTIRLHARLLAYPDDPTKSVGNKLLWQMAELVLPEQNNNTQNHGRNEPNTQYGIFNQALMDLGSMVCVPKSPDCFNCPVVKLCQTALKGLQDAIPALKKEQNFEERSEAALVIEKNGKYLMMRYPEGVRWAGLWDFPRHVVLSEKPLEYDTDFCLAIQRMIGYKIAILSPLTTIRHSVTRFKITLNAYFAETLEKCSKSEYEIQWVKEKDLAKLALNTTGRKITKLCKL
ncbi:MAG: A/G-specific adenine glycosylase [Planctomycetaceae bacterium]|nr:A/G-specific adenine glycosylase [Planctomycetaceae bacterium]